MGKNSTIHNPVNFEPSDYRVIEYFDNQPPQPYFGMNRDEHLEWVKAWHRELETVYGPDYRSKLYKCVHCGQGNVRYIVACEHIPTGEVVTFGDICVNRLGFENADQFKAKMIRTKAKIEADKIKKAEEREKILTDNPDFAKALTCYEDHKNMHRGNFTCDIVSKFNQYGSLSTKQMIAFSNAIVRDHEYQDRKKAEDNEVKGDAPTGRVEVTGKVLSTQWRENDFGGSLKMLVKLENNSKVWLTAPKYGEGYDKDSVITFKATFKQAPDDIHFAFGSRPHLVSINS